ncbi:MAG: hypothetical protein L6R45_05870 [Anaerolineae bacterium]|nr:hypothetical protein [Anaerolineae bacterium]
MNFASCWSSFFVPKCVSFLIIVTASLSACTAPQPIEVEAAQAALLAAWQADQHIVWEIDWPAAPVGGPLTVATWRAGPRYRLEILEAVAPDLMGQALIFDGTTAWRYQRFDSPAVPQPVEARLSPATDAFEIIARLLATTPSSATQEATQVGRKPAQKITLTFTEGDSLTVWRDEASGLPVRLNFVWGRQHATLRARSFELLSNPPQDLFELR